MICARTRQNTYLVYTGQTQRLLGLVLTNNLDDSQWPIVQYPNKWPRHDHDIAVAFETVKRTQWIFFPLNFKTSQLNNSEFEPDCILPIDEVETIIQSGSSCIYKIRIHDGYSNFTPSTESRFHVIKSYLLQDAGSIFSNEVDALNMLRLDASGNLITFYGSFRKAGHGYLILEFADEGNLSDYFVKTRPPTIATDINLFWSSLLKSLLGLDRIHQLIAFNSNMKQIIQQGIHQDIKPANILLFKGSSESPYEFTTKIADFGLFSHARKTRSNSSEAKGLNRYGSQVYSAPEVSANVRNKTKGLSLITPGADIFSFGAVLSAAAAWIIGGKELLDEYYHLRIKAHATMKRFCGTDFEGCFHAGLQEFPVIAQMHSRIRDQCHRNGVDKTTPRILEIVQSSMLLPKSNQREQASALYERFCDLLTPLSPVLTQSLRRRSTMLSSYNGDGGTTPTSLNSIDRINTFFSGRIVDPTVKNLVDQITRNLRDRDQFFFIDDSTSMQQHRDIVIQGFQAISSIAKRLDPNKVELAFASSPTQVKRARSTKSLVKKLKTHEFRHDPHLMENSLSELIENQIIRKLPIKKMGFNINPIARKRVSIYIFTDGNWGDDSKRACRVERPVEGLIREMKSRKLSAQQVTLHFVRFGDSKEGGRHLQYLDQFGERNDIDFDIVDVKHISSDVVSLFYGPLSHHSDRFDENI